MEEKEVNIETSLLDPTHFSPEEVRGLIRRNQWSQSTSGVASGYVQANLVILRKEYALEFMQFCHRNPKPCPLLDVTDIGSSKPVYLGEDADIKTDIGFYRVYRNGKLTETLTDLNEIWEKDMVGFLLGCSLTFERHLVNTGIYLHHYKNNNPVSMYKTNIPCVEAGIFKGNMVVSMRPIPVKELTNVVLMTSKFSLAHGAPIHIGSPEYIGIKELHKPDFGEVVPMPDDCVPVFWACGVTPQAIAIENKIDLMITHEPGYMFVSDIPDDEIVKFNQ